MRLFSQEGSKLRIKIYLFILTILVSIASQEVRCLLGLTCTCPTDLLKGRFTGEVIVTFWLYSISWFFIFEFLCSNRSPSHMELLLEKLLGSPQSVSQRVVGLAGILIIFIWIAIPYFIVLNFNCN